MSLLCPHGSLEPVHQAWCRQRASLPSVPAEDLRWHDKGWESNTAQLLSAWQSGRISADDLLGVSP